MDEQTKIFYQKLSIFMGPIFVTTFVIFWGWLGNNLPPPHPDWPAQAFTDRYVNNLAEIRVGFLVALVTICLYLPWTAYVTTRMKRIETGPYPVLAYTQLLGGCLTVIVVSISMWCWVVAAQRPERMPEITQMLTDAGWLMNDTLYMCTTMQMWAMALCILHDKKAKVPVMPNWACYLTIFCGATFFPASLTAILRDGPFAYDGLLGYWVPYPAWLIWMYIASYFLLGDLKRRVEVGEGEEAPLPVASTLRPAAAVAKQTIS